MELTTCNRQDDAGGSRCVPHIARAGPFGNAPYRDWPADAHREGLLVVACQHVLCQVLTEAIVGVIKVQALHYGLHLQHAMQLKPGNVLMAISSTLHDLYRCIR